jgi:hypothetical protein
VVGVILATTALTYYVYREWYVPVLLLLISMGALSAYFFPIRYTLSDQRVKMTNFLAREDKGWDDFWTYHVYPDGVQLAFDQRNLRGRVRGGVMLYYDDQPAHRDRIMEIVTSHLQSPREVGARPGGRTGS